MEHKLGLAIHLIYIQVRSQETYPIQKNVDALCSI